MTASGQVALVTGGTRGIGRAIAETLLAQGWRVVVCGRTPPDAAVTANGAQAAFRACDVRDAAAIEALVAGVVADHGRLDCVVNNAGGSPAVAAADASPRFSEAIVALNLLGPLHLSRAAYRQMVTQDQGGVIINIASVSGVRPSPGTAAYGAAKAGLLSLTETLAMEWGPKIRVNAVLVGLLSTEGEAGAAHYGDAANAARIAASLPMKRMATGQDVADVVRYLVSPQAAFISGARIAVHSGGERPSFLDAAQG